MRSVLNRTGLSADYISNAQDSTDLELFRAISVGSEAALKELYHRYYHEVYRFLRYQTQDEMAAEDLAQEVFLAAWQQAGRFRGGSSVKTWLLRVAFYRAASWLKGQKQTVQLEAVFQVPSEGLEADERLIAAWRSGQVQEALERLSTKHRTALELIFFHDLTYKEAARVVGCPVGTMKSRVSHALKQINGMLAQAGIEE